MHEEHRAAYSIDEIAQLLGVSRDLINTAIRTGRLGSLKVGRRRLITKDQLDDFLAQASRGLVSLRNEHAPLNWAYAPEPVLTGT